MITLTEKTPEQILESRIAKAQKMNISEEAKGKMIASYQRVYDNRNNTNKKSNKKWAKRESMKNYTPEVIDDMHAYNRANALKNLPSSMR